MWNITFLITGLVFITLLIIVFFSKQTVMSNENKSFKYVLVVSASAFIVELLLQLIVKTYGIDVLIVDILARIYLLILLLWYMIFSIYVSFISTNKKKSNRIFNLIIVIVFIFGAIAMAKLNISKYYDGSKMYTYGAAVDSLKYFIVFYIILWFILLWKGQKKLISKQYFPIYANIVLLTISTIIQTLDPGILIASMIGTIVCYTMYFTIENPDIKMLQEFKTAKDRAEKANEEKELFLYNVTQDLRTPLGNIRKACDHIVNNTKEEDTKEGIYYISSNTTSMFNTINNVLDVTNMEITNIKVYNAKYNTKLVMQELYKIYSNKVPKNIKLTFNIDSNIPEMLYGDALRIKQLLTIVLDNAFKYTEKGFIELNLNTIVKNDVCRLLIKVEDSGVGIKASELEEIFNKDNQMYASLDKIDDNKKNLAIAKSIATLLGGILLLESEIGSGTKVTLVLDQKIYTDRSEELEKLENDTSKYVSKTKVMVVSEDSEYLNSLVKKLSKYDINLETLDLGAKCLEKIRSNNKYDLIIMDEELTRLSALDILNKLKEVRGFDIDVAILTNNPENKGYIKDGFKYVLNRKISQKELDQLMNGIE